MGDRFEPKAHLDLTARLLESPYRSQNPPNPTKSPWSDGTLGEGKIRGARTEQTPRNDPASAKISAGVPQMSARPSTFCTPRSISRTVDRLLSEFDEYAKIRRAWLPLRLLSDWGLADSQKFAKYRKQIRKIPRKKNRKMIKV